VTSATFPFHRLARSWTRYRWWKPLITGLIAVGFFLVFSLFLGLIGALLVALSPDSLGAPLLNMIKTGEIDNGSPVVLAVSLLSVALMMPSLLLAALIMGSKPVGLLWSVAGRIRWRWMLWLLLPVAIAYGVSYLFSLVLLPLITGEALPPVTITDSTWIVVAVAVLLVPLQATAEELVFRGYLMQTIGGWLKHPLFAILLPIPLFTFGHDYELWGLLDVTFFALAAAWLSWRTGGLEAAIVAHIVNNTVIFAIGAFGLVDVNAKDGGGPLDLALSAGTLVLYAWLVTIVAKRYGLQRTRTVEIPDPFVAPAEWVAPVVTAWAPPVVASREWAPPVVDRG
jgi:membrane protease YdiL (CAAX protease family)